MRLITLILIVSLTLTALFIRAQNSWEQSNPNGITPPARYGHTWAVIVDKIYLFGGKTNGKLSSLDTLHLYSSVLMEWTEEMVENTPPPARYHHQVIEKDGKLYVFFGMGDDGALDDIWEYDPNTKLWNQIIPESTQNPEARSEHSATLYGNTVYIVGGINSDGNPLSDIWAYRFTNNTWQKYTSISGTSISGHTAVFHEGNLLLYGGLRNGTILTPEILNYSPGSDTWSSFMPSGDFYPTSNASFVKFGSDVFLFGGYSGLYESVCFKWDLTTNIFTPLVNGPSLADAYAATLPGTAHAKYKESFYQQFILFGGRNSTDIYNDTWIYTSDILTSVEMQKDVNLNINIFPNPANDLIFVDYENFVGSNAEIFDITGKIVKTILLTESKMIIDINDLTEGLYLMRIIQDGINTEFKLIISR